MTEQILDVIAAELTWVDGKFMRDMKVAIGKDGRIAAVGDHVSWPVTQHLKRRALLPGFVNAHSHAFQRGLRGRGETFPDGAGSFWTWREEMYALVQRMTPELMHTLSLQAFNEMRAAGITTVGEFHYLHHLPDSEQFELDDAVIAAASDAGIRMVLLQAFYKTGGIGQPLAGGQRQFATLDHDAYWHQFDRLAARLDTTTQSIGVVAHSIRAADRDDIAMLHTQSKQRGVVFHMHVEEQPAEIEASIAAYGQPPMRVLLDHLDIDDRFTAVHCTHTHDADMTGFCEARGNVCICPLTEANLGDGLADLPHVYAHGGHVCLGTDSNARISMLEEMRWLEYGQRLAQQSRGVCRSRQLGSGERWDRPVLEAATIGGARSLGVEAGQLAVGQHADLLVIDLDDASLSGYEADSLAAGMLCGSGDAIIADSLVAGRSHRRFGC